MTPPKPGPTVQLEEHAIRTVLAQELGAVLAVPLDQLDPSQSLDEHGLDSVDAVITAGAVSERLGLDLPPELFIQYRTLDEAVAAILRLSRPAPEPGGLSAPVYLFAGWGGRDSRLARLTARPGTRLPTHIVLIGTWQGWVRDRLRFGGIVTRACDEIEQRSPAGDLHVGGYSQGGTLAFAVAAALQRRGRTVRSLSIFDATIGAPRPGSAEFWARQGQPATRPRPLREAGRFVLDWLASLRRPDREHGRLRIRIAVQLFPRLPPPAEWALLAVLARLPRLVAGRGGANLDNLLQMHVFGLLWAEWLPAATPLDLGCRTFVFRSQTHADDLGWGRFCPELTIIPVPGDHQTMFDPEYLDGLAAAFTTAVASAAG